MRTVSPQPLQTYHRAQDAPTAGVRELRASVTALLELFERLPELARLCLIGSLDRDPRMLALRSEVQWAIVQTIRLGWEDALGRRVEPSSALGDLLALVADATVEGMLAVIRARVREHDPPRLRELVDLLVAMAAAPVVGLEEASEELGLGPSR